MENYGMFFAGMLAMALFGGLIAFLITRPWLRPMRRDWEASHEVIAENSRLAATQIRRQTAEEQDRANEAAITAEQTRSRLVEIKSRNDQGEIERTATVRQTDIEVNIAAEETRLRLIQAKSENDQLEIERRAALKRAGINPDAPKPKNWFTRHRYLILIMVMILGITAMITVKVLTK